LIPASAGRNIMGAAQSDEDSVDPNDAIGADEQALASRFGECGLEEFLEGWDTAFPRWWAITMYHVLTGTDGIPMSDAQAVAMTRSEKQIFFRGVKKAVGADEYVLEVFERMFPEDLMLDDVNCRLAFAYWATGATGSPPGTFVLYKTIRRALPGPVRSGFRKLLFNEPFLSASSVIESQILDDSWALSMAFGIGHWDRLFSSVADGRSFSRLVASIQWYGGPTLLVFSTDTGSVLGGVNSGPWEDLGGRYSQASATLFVYKPTFRLFPSTGKSENFAYLNQKNKYAPIGIAFGGQSSCPRLWMDQELDGHFLESDATFVAGKIKEDDEFQVSFKVEYVEMWGLGGPDALENQERRKNIQSDLRLQRRMVDRTRFAGNEFDREHLLGGAFGMADAAKAEVDKHRDGRA